MRRIDRGFFVLWLAGTDLRLTLLAIPPLLPAIHRDLALSESAVAALNNLPVLLLALAAIPGSLLIARIGARRALITGLVVIALASALRGAGPSTVALFAGTIVMGAGIAAIQPAFPALVRAWYPERIGPATSAWANGLLVGEGLAAALTIPLVLPLAHGSWGGALALWAVPVALTAACVAVFGPRRAPVQSAAPLWMPNWRNGAMWRMAMLQSSASAIYFGANTFIPDYFTVTGARETIGPALAAINLAQLPASLVLAVVPWRVLGHRRAALALAIAVALALLALLSANAILAVTGAAVLGLAGAYILVVTLALPALLAPAPDVARLSAGTYTLAYTIAFVLNLAAGALWDLTHRPAVAFVPVLYAIAAILIAGRPLLGRGLAEGALRRNT